MARAPGTPPHLDGGKGNVGGNVGAVTAVEEANRSVPGAWREGMEMAGLWMRLARASSYLVGTGPLRHVTCGM